MDESIRNAWISAGKFLQEGHSVASLKLIDSPIRPVRLDFSQRNKCFVLCYKLYVNSLFWFLLHFRNIKHLISTTNGLLYHID